MNPSWVKWLSPVRISVMPSWRIASIVMQSVETVLLVGAGAIQVVATAEGCIGLRQDGDQGIGGDRVDRPDRLLSHEDSEGAEMVQDFGEDLLSGDERDTGQLPRQRAGLAVPLVAGVDDRNPIHRIGKDAPCHCRLGAP
jgi:hypothetical protein